MRDPPPPGPWPAQVRGACCVRGPCTKLAPLQQRHAEIIRRDWPQSHARDDDSRPKSESKASQSPFCATEAAAQLSPRVHCLGRFLLPRVASHSQIYLEPRSPSLAARLASLLARGRLARAIVEQRCDRCRLVFSRSFLRPSILFAHSMRVANTARNGLC